MHPWRKANPPVQDPLRLHKLVLSFLTDWKSITEISDEFGMSEHQVSVLLRDLERQLDTQRSVSIGLKKIHLYRLRKDEDV